MSISGVFNRLLNEVNKLTLNRWRSNYEIYDVYDTTGISN
jgi:hypothetical protein